MKNMKKRLNEEKGSITLFVLIAMIFFLTILIGIYMSTQNKVTIQINEISGIQEEYYSDINQIENIYNETLEDMDYPVQIILKIKETGEPYNLDQWTNKDLIATIICSEEYKKDDYTIEIGENVYTYNEGISGITITENCTITVKQKGRIKPKKVVKITKIDKEIPTVSLSPNGGKRYTMPTSGKATIKTMLTAQDGGGSELKDTKYAWSTSNTTEPTEWIDFENKETVSKADCTEGNYYLWTKVTDNAGNRADIVKVSNAFTVNANTSPESKITLTPNITEWTNENVIVLVTYGTNLTNNRKAGFGSATIMNASSVTVTKNGTVYAEATDIAGNKITESLDIKNIDKILPTVTLSPNGGTKYVMPTSGKATIKTTLTAQDEGGSKLKDTQYAWSTSNTDEPTSWTNFTSGATISKTDCTAGNYYLWTKVTDIAGNRASTVKVSNVFTVNANTSAGSKITLTPNTKEWTNQNVTVTVTYGEYLTQNKKAGVGSASTANATSVVVSANGTVYAEATDIVGNKVTANLAIGNIDKLLPTVALNPNGGIKYTMPTSGKAIIKTTLTANDTGGSGLNTLQYAWSTSNSTEPTSWINFTNGATISKTDCTAGNYYLWTKVTDKAGNRASTVKVSNVFTVNANTSAGSKITLTPNTKEWTNQNVTVTVTYGEYLTQNRKAGVGSASTANATSVVVSANGTVYAEATDIVGNKVTASLAIGNIDKILPTVVLNPNGGTKYTMPTSGNATIKTTLTASDTGGSGLNTLQYAWSTSNTQEPTTWTNFTSGATISKTDCTAGNYYLWTKVTDKAGNRASTVKVSNVFTVNANTSAGSKITLTPNTKEWTNQNVTVTVTYGEYLTQNRKAGVGSASTANATSVVVSANGTVYAEATDIAGNKVTASLKVGNIDKVKPAKPTVTNPSNGNWTKDNIKVTLTSSDNLSGIKQFQWFSNGAWTATSLTTSGNTGTIDFTIDRNETVRFRVIDNAGNVSEEATTVIKIDKTAPVGTSCEVKNLTTTGYDVYVYGVTDSGSGINRVQFPTWTEANGQDDLQTNWSTNSVATGKKQADGTTWVYHVNVTDHKNEYGKYITHIYIYDNLGQTKTMALNNIQVPGVTITYDYNGSKNYAQVNDSGKTMTGFTGIANYCPGLYPLETNGLKANDQLTMSFDVQYTNLTGNTSQNYRMNPQGSGNVTSWTPGIGFPAFQISGTGTYHYTGVVTITESMLQNSYFSLNLRTDYYTGGTITVTNFKVRRTTKTSVTKGYGSALGTLPSITEVGYNFNGWYTLASGGTKISTTTTTPAGNTTYYAQYGKNSYTMTYDSNYYGTSLWDDTYNTGRYNAAATVPTSKGNATDTSAKYGQTVKFVMPAGTSGGPYYSPSARLTAGKTYTWSVYIKTSSNKKLNIGDEQGGQKVINTTTSWQKVTHTFTANDNQYYAFVFYLSGSTWTAGDELQIHSLEIMEGTPSHTTAVKPYETTLATLPTPSRVGYTFKGWFTAPVGGTQITNSSMTPAKNTTYYAHWTVNQYTVAYKANGATGGTTANSTHYYDYPRALTSNGFARNYTVTYNYNGSGTANTSAIATYTFKNWNTATNGSGTAYSNAQSVVKLSPTNGATINLYAQWNAGSVTLPNPTRTGYTFAGWYDSANGGNKIGNAGTAYVPTANATLYAHWTINQYTVTVNPGGSKYTQNYASTKSISAPASSYTVAFNANGGGAVGSKTSSRNFTSWTLSGSGSVSSTTANPTTYTYGAGAGTLTANYNGTGNAIALPTPTRTGYTFNGWYTAASGGTKVGNAGANYSPTGNVTLYAQWTINQYTVTVNPGGSKYTQNYASTKSISAPASSYTVAFNANGGGAVGSKTSSRNFTSWTLSGSGSVSSTTTNPTTYTYGAGAGTLTANYNGTGNAIALPSTSRTGYTFNGWYTAASGGTKVGNAGADYSPTGNVTLYAQWIDNIPPTVSLSPNGGNYVKPTSGNATIKTALSASDSGSGLNILQYAWSTSNTTEPTAWTNFTNGATISKTDCVAGNYYLWTKVTDKAGNRATTIKVSGLFKVNASTITLTPSTTAWTNGNISVAVSYGAYLTQNKKAGLGSANTANATSVALSANGTVYAEATDTLGNKVTASRAITNIDKTLPTVSFGTNGGNFVKPTSGNATIRSTISASDSGGSGLNVLQYAWSTSNTTEPTAWTNFSNGATISKTDCTAGTYYLWTKVTDKAGNRATTGKVSNAFKVNVSTISLTPNTTSWTSGNVVVTVGYGSYLTQNKKAGLGSANTANATSVTVSANGTVYAEATDTLGNKVTASRAITNIDKTVPTVSLSPNGGTYYIPQTGGTKALSSKLTATNSGGSGLSILQYAWSTSNATEPTAWTNFSNGGTVSYNGTEGTWYLWTKVTNGAGTRATSVKVSNAFYIRKTTLTGGTTKYVAKGSTITLSISKNSYAGGVTWSTSNANNAKLNATSGDSITLTGVVAGTYTVTAREANGGSTTSFTIQVTELTAGGDLTLLEGNTATLTAPTKSSNAGTVSYSVTTGAGNISVNASTGLVTANEALAHYTDSVITARESNGGATCTYKVRAKVWNGSGTSSDPYQIANLRDIKKLATKVDKATATSSSTTGTAYRYQGYYFKQTADINLGCNSSNQWNPIGYGYNTAFFNGIYQGNNRTISNIYKVSTTEEYVGLFANIGSGATVSDLNLSGTVQGRVYAGLLAGSSYGTISNCKSSGSVKGAGRIGGIVGWATKTIQKCTNNATISGIQDTGASYNRQIGGIVGMGSNLQISNCLNTASVSYPSGFTEGGETGGIVGRTEATETATVLSCENRGSISSNYMTGGIAGNVDGNPRVTSCINRGAVTGQSQQGGIAGGASAKVSVPSTKPIIEKSCNVAKITGIYRKCTNSNYTTASNTGGIVGATNGALVTLCFNRGNIAPSNGGSSTYEGYGGIIGTACHWKKENFIRRDEITNCYNTGNVGDTTLSLNNGGIVGIVRNVYVANCYSTGSISCKSGGAKGGIYGNVATSLAKQSQTTNSYYTDGGSKSYTYMTGTGTSKTRVQMLSMEGTLGSGYKTDSGNSINAGFPILNWEVTAGKGWQQTNGVWCWIDPVTGAKATSWRKLKEKWYYFESNGNMAKGWKQIDKYWYYLDTSSGAMKTDWLQLDGKWYYLKPAGFSGWSGPEGSMLANCSAKIGSKTYNFNASGVCTNP